MTKKAKLIFISAIISLMLSSCYSYTSVVGKGAQGTTKVTKWNHYLVGGLAPINVSDSKKMAEESEDYTIVTKQSFINGLISALTLGIYSPTTTTVTK